MDPKTWLALAFVLTLALSALGQEKDSMGGSSSNVDTDDNSTSDEDSGLARSLIFLLLNNPCSYGGCRPKPERHSNSSNNKKNKHNSKHRASPIPNATKKMAASIERLKCETNVSITLPGVRVPSELIRNFSDTNCGRYSTEVALERPIRTSRVRF